MRLRDRGPRARASEAHIREEEGRGYVIEAIGRVGERTVEAAPFDWMRGAPLRVRIGWRTYRLVITETKRVEGLGLDWRALSRDYLKQRYQGRA